MNVHTLCCIDKSYNTSSMGDKRLSNAIQNVFEKLKSMFYLKKEVQRPLKLLEYSKFYRRNESLSNKSELGVQS